MARTQQVLRFKIALLDVEPPVWRRIEVPASFSFWDLHVAIQDAMGWQDCHLHEFRIIDQSGKELRIGIPDDSGWGERLTAGWKRKIAPVFRQAGDEALYLYDMGDGWEHALVLEALEPAASGVRYPLCVAGQRSCPPEDCGGAWGYEHLIEVLADPKHEEHAELLEWIGGPFDAEAFDATKVVFDDPKRRLEFVLS